MNAFFNSYKPFRCLSPALVAGGLLLATTVAQADIKYTKSTRMGEDADAKEMSQITTYVKEGFERTETTSSYGPAKMTDIALMFCAKHQNVRINPSLKIYTISSINNVAPATGNDKATNDATAPKSDPKTTGKITITSSVKDLGEDTVAGFKTRHYMVTMKIQNSGCAGDGETNSKMELWVADIRDANPCKDVSPVDYNAMASGAQSNCKLEFEQKGDVAAYNKVYQGLIMRMKMYNGDKVMMVQEVTMLSQAKLDDTPFAIPADYREVSAEEYQKAQSEAMMKAIMQQAQNGGGNDNGNDANDDKKTNNDDGDKNNGDNNNDGNANKDDGDKDKGEDAPAEEKPKKKKKFGGLKLPF